jgi:DNA polymerase-3 subunit epsilon
LCTVRLSRRLYPQAGRHNLDTIIERHGLRPEDRHRALGDARILWQFVQTLYRDKPADEIDGVIARILKTPSLPPQLPVDALAQLPEAPGVYCFYGLNPLPLYVGKSINLRERVAAHFSSDYRSANDARLSAEITRIEVEETAGELGALLRESQLIKTLLPAYQPAFAPPQGYGRHRLGPGACGTGVRPFRRNRSGCNGWAVRAVFVARPARATLRNVAPSARLCWSELGLERRVGPCFARQVQRCDGACVGAQTREAHAARLREALSSFGLQRWPHPGMVAVKETDVLGERTDVHVFDRWCWLGTAHDEGSFGALVEAPPRGEFDLDIYRLLVKHLPHLKATPLER